MIWPRPIRGTAGRWPVSRSALFVCGAIVFSGSVARAQEEVPSASFAPSLTIGGGVSRFIGDLGESDYGSVGPVVRVGFDFPGTSLALVLAHWPDVNSFRMTSMHLEVQQALWSPRRFTPSLLLGIGRTWAAYRLAGPAVAPDGGSAAVGLAARVTASPWLAVDADIRVRTDEAGFNGEWRVMGTYTRGARPAAPARGRVEAISLWMIDVSGPWIGVSPTLGLRAARPLRPGVAAALTLAIAHWQIPSASSPAGYLWDTRAAVAMAQGEWRFTTGLPIGLRSGPAVTIMGEGPDNGVTVGVGAELFAEIHLHGVRLEGSLGWLWLARGESVDPGDQHGLTVGLGFGTHE